MRKFKLIKKYPSLPKDWEIGMEVGLGDRTIDYSPCSSKYFDFRISNNEVESYPEFWQEIKKPLFVTEDGVEIFEGDFPWVVNSKNNYDIYQWDEGCMENGIKSDYCKKLKYFSTKEVAENWIKNNKPEFSKQQILDAISEIKDNTAHGIFFSKIVREKLGI